MAIVQIDVNAKNTAANDILRLREQMNQLTRVINRQRTALQGASKAEAEAIRSNIQYNQSLQRTNRVQQSGLRVKIARINQLAREQREQENAARAVARAGRAYLDLGFALTQIGNSIAPIAFALDRMVRGWIQATTEIERYASTMEIAAGNSASATIQIERLLDITRDLVGVDTGTLIQFASRFQTVGLSARQAENIIVSVTKRMEEQGKAAHVTRRVLEQFSDAINSNVVDLRDFRPILREYPGLYRDLSVALGVSISSIEDLRSQADTFGGIRNLIVEASEEMRGFVQGAEIDTLNYQFNQLEDNILLVRNALGNALRPIVLETLRVANSLAEAFANADPAIQAFVATLAGVGAVISRVGVAILQLGAIYIVTAQIKELGTAFASLTNTAVDFDSQIRNTNRRLRNLVGGMALATVAIAAGIAIWTKLTEQTRLAREELERFNSLQTAIRRSLSQGNFAIESQLRQLIEYRAELEKNREALQQSISDRQELQRFSNQIESNFVVRGDVQRLEQLDAQIQSIIESERRLQAVLTGLTADAGTREYVKGYEAFREEVDLARQKVIEFRKANTENTAAGKRALLDFKALADAFANYGKNVADATRATVDLQKSLISLDYEIRSAQTALRSSTLDNIDENYTRAVTALRKEYDERQSLKRAEIQDKEALDIELHRIEQQYLFELGQLQVQYQDRKARLEDESVEATIRRYQRAHEFRRKEEEKTLRYIQALRDEFSQQQEREAFLAYLPSALAIERLALFLQRVDGAKQTLKLLGTEAQRVGGEVTAGLQGIFAPFANLLDRAERGISIEERQAAIDKRVAEAVRPQTTDQSGVVGDYVKAFREAESGVDALRKRYNELNEAQEEAVRDARANLRRFNRTVTAVVSNFTRTLTDFAFNADRDFKEVLKSFVQSSLAIIIQYKVQVELRKRLSDEITNYEIANIRRKAAAEFAASAASVASTAATVAPAITNIAGTAAGLSNPVGAGISALTVLLKIGTNEVKDITHIQDDIKAQRRY